SLSTRTAPPSSSPLSLHDALPILRTAAVADESFGSRALLPWCAAVPRQIVEHVATCARPPLPRTDAEIPLGKNLDLPVRHTQRRHRRGRVLLWQQRNDLHAVRGATDPAVRRTPGCVPRALRPRVRPSRTATQRDPGDLRRRTVRGGRRQREGTGTVPQVRVTGTVLFRDVPRLDDGPGRRREPTDLPRGLELPEPRRRAPQWPPRSRHIRAYPGLVAAGCHHQPDPEVQHVGGRFSRRVLTGSGNQFPDESEDEFLLSLPCSSLPDPLSEPSLSLPLLPSLSALSLPDCCFS